MEDLTQRLPHDVLADVLRHLQTTAPCSLAACRCVCKAWCAVVDAHRLLTDLLPHSLTSIFLHFDDLFGRMLPKALSLAMSSTTIAPFDYLDTHNAECVKIVQHCNGLLLLADVEWEEDWWVLNPATRQWAHLTTSPPMRTPGMEDSYFDQENGMDYHDKYLVFDPTVSPHYEVFLVKRIPSRPDTLRFVECHVKQREWPPSTYVLLVFSSRTKQWDERPFVREGKAAGTIGDLLEDDPPDHCYATYWREALYFHQHDFILRYVVTHILDNASLVMFRCSDFLTLTSTVVYLL
ncbi:hypothetical protein CFC21_052715 [Triticum aestivum]|uniref:F-box domain-containing protein n=2 Tax=Triticum aestivum TaxID=4565 RepID=A0A3B6NHN8_WHEAT|nr:hypothetical protein CFC21_052715 [Triticum aestivum]